VITSSAKFVLKSSRGCCELLSVCGSKRSETGKSTVESSEKLVWALSLSGVSDLSTGVSVELVDV